MGSVIGRLVVDVITNKSGGAVAYGDVVILDAANDHSFTTTTTGGFTAGIIGVCVEPNGIANNSSGRVQLQGYCPQVNANASVTRGYFLKTHTAAKQATGSSTRVVGSFGVAVTTSASPAAILWGFPDASSASGNVASDSIWDAAGDLVVGSGSDTAARLAIGAVGGHVSRINGAVAWDSGTSNPGSAASGDRYYRSDLGLAIKYDGTRWVCMCPHELVIQTKDAVAYTGISATTDPIARILVPYKGTYGLYMERWEFVSIVVTTNDGTKFWGLRLYWNTTGGSATNLATGVTTAADTPTNHVWHSEALGSVLDSTAVYLGVSATKTSTPGNLFTSGQIVLHYRYVIT